MAFFLFKVLTTAIIIAIVSEISRRFTLMAAVLASLPLVSILAFIWIYVESRDIPRLIQMSQDIFWLVLPSLAFFVTFPLFLKQGIVFWWALLLSIALMLSLYGITIYLLKSLT